MSGRPKKETRIWCRKTVRCFFARIKCSLWRRRFHERIGTRIEYYINSRLLTGIIEKPKALGDIRDVSYIYPILWRFGLIRVSEKTEKALMRKTG